MATFVQLLLNFALVNYATGIPQISLEYNPYPLPSYNPNPGQNTAHTVPPGKPWPANPEDYNSFSQTTSPRPPAPSRPTVVNRFPETTTPKKEITRPNLDYGKPPISLEYNPFPLPSFHPNPGENTAHTVPPGKPWPANPEDYDSFSQTTSPRPPAPSRPTVVNRFPETTTPKKEITRPNLDYGKPPISLEYNPFPLPSFHPNPGENTAHTVPPGKPWPANPEDYDSFSQTTSPRPPAPSRPTVVNRFPETTTPKKEITRPNLDYGKPPISLEYNPFPLPSFHPNPGENTAHTVPPGKPWPANPEDYDSFSQTTSPRPPAPSRPTVVNRFPETTTPKKEITRPNLDYGKPPISLEYNPFPLPSFHPNPGENTAHTVPPGKPWPANPEDYDSFSQTTSPRPPAPSRPTVVNRFPETTTPKKEITRPNLDYGKPPASLEYNPYPLPSYNPNPGENTALAIPPGKPWPANPEDYNSSTSTTNQNLNDEIQETPQQKPSSPPEVYLIYPEDLWFIYLSDRFREMISNSGIKPSFVLDYKPPFRPKPTEIHHGGPWPENPDDQPLIKDQEDQVQPLIVLDYKPNPPSYRPTPTEPPQVVPPGEPWPANPEDYTTFGQNNSTQNQNQNIENRFQEVAPFPDQVPPLIVLDYKPNRPFYRPSPTEIKQRVPPGEPWPANPEDYATFGQSNPSKPAQNQQNLENRFQETTSPPANQVQPLYVLDYKPNRPFYRPSPTEIQQVVPPGKPWPANPEDYVTFGQGNSPKPIQNQQQKQQDIENCLEAVVQPLIVLDYKPNRPFYRPSPTETQQVVPPGKPWPATPAQQTIENRFEEVTTPKEQSEPIETKPQLVLDYKPDRPSFLPNPLNVVGQVAPPVKPWSVTPTTTEEATTPKQENKPVETKPRPNPGGVAPPLENGGGQTVLEYYPVSSINQGSAVGQIVKPGKPWPANPEKSSPESVQNEETSSPNQAKSENSQSTTENNVELKLYTSKILNDVVSPTLVTSKNDSQSEKDRV